MSDFYSVTECMQDVYRISSAEQVHMDLLVGEKAALLFDTGYGLGNLRELVKSITTLPLYVVNSHGHTDHTCGNFQFEEDIYIHPDDMELCRMHNAGEQRKRNVELARHTVDFVTGLENNILPDGFDEGMYAGQGCGRLVPVREGHVFDLGGISLEVVEFPGHTRGSIGLFCKEKGLLYAGDAINSSLWLFLPESLDLSTYIETLKKAQRIGFHQLVMSHEPQLADRSILDVFLDCATHLDFGKGLPYTTALVPDCSARICIRQGFQEKDMGKPGFASIVIGQEHL